MDLDLYTLVKNLSASYGDLFALLMNFGIVAGLVAVLWGLNALRPDSNHRERGGGSGTGALWSIGIGICLIFVPSTVDAFTASSFNASSSEFGYFSDASTSDPFAPIKGFIRLFGAFAFVRGLFAARTLGVHGTRSGMSMWKVGVWLISGTLLINLSLTLKAMAATLGVTVFDAWY